MNGRKPAVTIQLHRTAGQRLDKVDNEMDSVDLTTAAGILGLSVATLRKRLQRGTIAGFKAADGSWRVVLDKVDSPGQMGGQGLDSPGQDHAALVEMLRDEVQFLRSQLQARDNDIQRLHVLLQQHQQPVKALPDHGRAQQDWMQNWMRMWMWWMPR
jgi:hypothetical protein